MAVQTVCVLRHPLQTEKSERCSQTQYPPPPPPPHVLRSATRAESALLLQGTDDCFIAKNRKSHLVQLKKSSAFFPVKSGKQMPMKKSHREMSIYLRVYNTITLYYMAVDSTVDLYLQRLQGLTMMYWCLKVWYIIFKMEMCFWTATSSRFLWHMYLILTTVDGIWLILPSLFQVIIDWN